MTLISAVIINYNGREILRECLESLKRQTSQPDEVLLIDNMSNGYAQEKIRPFFPRASVIENQQNLPFTSAANQGLGLANGEFVLLLNNDIILNEDYIKVLLELMQQHDKIGLSGGKVLSLDRRHIDSAGQLLAQSRKVIDRGYREVDNGQYDEPGHIFGIAASAAVYRRKMLDDLKTGGEYFDNDFEFFYEDMDLAWRAQKKGWRSYYHPGAVAYHRRGHTTKTRVPRFRFLRKYYISCLSTELQLCAVRNRYLMMIKNDCLKDILKDLLFILWFEIRQASYILLFRPVIIAHLLKDKERFLRQLNERRNRKEGPGR